MTSPLSRWNWRLVYTLSLAKNSHHWRWVLHFPLPKIRTFRFSLHTSRLSLLKWSPFSKELKQLIRRKNRLFKKAHASGNTLWPLENLLFGTKQNNGSNKTSKKRSLQQSGQHSIRPELFPVKMVAGRKRSLWIEKRCILLCSAAAGQLWKCHLRAGWEG